MEPWQNTEAGRQTWKRLADHDKTLIKAVRETWNACQRNMKRLADKHENIDSNILPLYGWKLNISQNLELYMLKPLNL